MGIETRFRLIPLIATLVLMALGLVLGQWQTRRAQEKDAIEASLVSRARQAPLRLPAGQSEDVEFRRVTARGRFVPGWTIYLDNRPYNGRAGFYVVTPFKIGETDKYVLVQRGWIARNAADRKSLPPDRLPQGEVELDGVARAHAGHVMQLGSAEPLSPNAIVQNLEIADFIRASRLDLENFIVEQTGDTGDGLLRDWPRPSHGSDKHRAYAFQWYALAAMAFVFFVVTGFKRGKP